VKAAASAVVLLLLTSAAAPEAKVREIALAAGTRWETPAFVRVAREPGPTVMVVGGMHGNEAAGGRAAEGIRHWRIARGKLVVIPRANRLGLARSTRKVPDGKPYDLNRRFPSKPDGKVTGPLAGSIWKLAQEHRPDWLVDLHESRDYRYRTTKKRKTLGNTLIVFPEKETERVAGLMAAAANRLTPRKERKWVVLRWPIEGSLTRAAAARLGTRSLISESTGKDYLSIRIRQHRIVVHRLLRELRMLPEGASPYDVLPEERRRGEVRVALYNSYGTGGKSAWRVERCLTRHPEIVTRRITATEIMAGALGQFDVVVFPGGTGTGTARTIEKKGRSVVRKFVSDGGGLLGICAGAYFATRHYSWSLGVLDAKVLDTAHWARGSGTVRMKLSRAGRRLFSERKAEVPILYWQGPILARAGDPRIPDFEVLATYRTEIAKNGAPRGVMIGTPAIVRGRFGKGRVLVSSPHPEQTSALFDYVPRAVRWLATGR
jgi:glutamine amidotransferase-like uncharacterized protein